MITPFSIKPFLHLVFRIPHSPGLLPITLAGIGTWNILYLFCWSLLISPTPSCWTILRTSSCSSSLYFFPLYHSLWMISSNFLASNPVWICLLTQKSYIQPRLFPSNPDLIKCLIDIWSSVLNKSKINSWFPNKTFLPALVPFLVNTVWSSSFQLLRSKTLGVITDFFLLHLQISLPADPYWLCLTKYPEPVCSLSPPLHHLAPSTFMSFLDNYNTLLNGFPPSALALLKSIPTREIFENVRQYHFSIQYIQCFLNLFKVKVFCGQPDPIWSSSPLHLWFHLLLPCHSLCYSYSIGFFLFLNNTRYILHLRSLLLIFPLPGKFFSQILTWKAIIA